MTWRILTVCHGNICRSPIAAAAIETVARRNGVSVEVDSAGTGSWNVGEPPHHQAVAAAGRAGLEVSGRARSVNRADFDRFDIILAMDRSNARDLSARAPSLESAAKVRLFRTYDPISEEDEIADPWGGPDEVYDETVRLCLAAAEGLIESLRSFSVEDSVAPE